MRRDKKSDRRAIIAAGLITFALTLAAGPTFAQTTAEVPPLKPSTLQTTTDNLVGVAGATPEAIDVAKKIQAGAFRPVIDGIADETGHLGAYNQAFVTTGLQADQAALKATAGAAAKVGQVTGALDLGYNAGKTAVACTQEGVSVKCVTAGLDTAGSGLGLAAMPVLAAGVTVVSAGVTCTNEGASQDCIDKGLGATASVVSTLGPVGLAVGSSFKVGYALGKLIEPLVDVTIGANSPLFNDTPTAQVTDTSDFNASAAKMKADATSNYQKTATDLNTKQAARNAQQAAIAQAQAEAAQAQAQFQAQQAAAAQQAANQAASSAAFAGTMNQFITTLSGALIPNQSRISSADAGGAKQCPFKKFNTPDGCHPGHDESGHPGGCMCG